MRALVLFLLFSPGFVFGNRIYSYVNEQGVRVYTNEPSKRADLSQAPLPAAKRVRTAESTGYLPLIQEVSSRYGIDDKLVEAIIAVESNFNPDAVSSKNCKGLMQLHPDTARRYGVDDVFNPAENIEGGVRYLQFLMESFDDLKHVVAAYNAGENAVKKYAGIPPYRETRDYVEKVGRLYDLSASATARSLEPEPHPRRVFRVSLPNGGVLYTNTPSESLER